MDEKPKTRTLYNPTIDSVETDYDKNGEHPEHHILEAGEVKEFPIHIADLIEEKLAKKMLWKNYSKGTNTDEKYREFIDIIRVT